MKTPSFVEKNDMGDVTISQPNSKDSRKPLKFTHGLLAGVCFALVVGGLVITAMYLGMKGGRDGKPRFKRYAARVSGTNVKETIIVTNTQVEYILEDGTLAMFDFGKDLVTFVPPKNHKLNGTCLVANFDPSAMMKPTVIMNNFDGQDVVLDISNSKEFRFSVTDIKLSEKVLTETIKDVCTARDIYMLKPDGTVFRK